jgi:hypothetical protein
MMVLTREAMATLRLQTLSLRHPIGGFIRSDACGYFDKTHPTKKQASQGLTLLTCCAK